MLFAWAMDLCLQQESLLEEHYYPEWYDPNLKVVFQRSIGKIWKATKDRYQHTEVFNSDNNTFAAQSAIEIIRQEYEETHSFPGWNGVY